MFVFQIVLKLVWSDFRKCLFYIGSCLSGFGLIRFHNTHIENKPIIYYLLLKPFWVGVKRNFYLFHFSQTLTTYIGEDNFTGNHKLILNSLKYPYSPWGKILTINHGKQYNIVHVHVCDCSKHIIHASNYSPLLSKQCLQRKIRVKERN